NYRKRMNIDCITEKMDINKERRYENLKSTNTRKEYLEVALPDSFQSMGGSLNCIGIVQFDSYTEMVRRDSCISEYHLLQDSSTHCFKYPLYSTIVHTRVLNRIHFRDRVALDISSNILST
ncbi:1145_t:CDS:2, partial [Funneliformis caledonium]